MAYTHECNLSLAYCTGTHPHLMVQVFLSVIIRKFPDFFQQYPHDSCKSTFAGSYQWGPVLLNVWNGIAMKQSHYQISKAPFPLGL